MDLLLSTSRNLVAVWGVLVRVDRTEVLGLVAPVPEVGNDRLPYATL